MIIKRLVNNKAISFVLLKYVAFGIQLINSVLIAKFLGVYFFGIYGFVLMLLQYLNYSNFGVQYSYSVLCSDVSTKEGNIRTHLTGTSISLIICVSLFLGILYFSTYSLDLFPKYRYSEYSFFILIIAILQYFNLLFVNIFRINGNVGMLNVYYLILPLVQLITLLFFKSEALFYALLVATLISHAFSVILFVLKSPIVVRKSPIFRFKYARIIIKRGFFLLLYNFTYVGILLTAKTIVSNRFSVEDFALFSFANSIANAVFLLMGSLDFLFYPKLINVISSKHNLNELIFFIERIRKFYLTLTLLVVFLSMFSFPLLYYFLPQYAESSACLQILLLAQVVIRNSYGYSTLLVQKGKELQMTCCAVIAIVVIVLGSLGGLQYYDDMIIVAISVFFGVLIYNVLIGYLGNKILSQFNSVRSFLKAMFLPSLFMPVLCCVILMLLSPFYIFNVVITIIFYMVLNRKQFKDIIKGGYAVVLKKDILTID